MVKTPHLPIKKFPTYEIYARFAPGTLDTITSIRKKYTQNLVYPRDIGICLFRGIPKNDFSTKNLQDKLTTIASLIVPFQVELLRPFRNKSAEERKYPASVYYEINNSPFNLFCADLRSFFATLPKPYRYGPQTNRSFKIGLTGEVESYEESDRIVNELLSLEKPKPILFDAFTLASRPNKKPLSELDDETQEFPFIGTEETFEEYKQSITAKRDEYIKQKLENLDQNKVKTKDAEATTLTDNGELTSIKQAEVNDDATNLSN